MYAQLCQRLNEAVPNFEDRESKTSTFRRLLLAKCKEEFDNRTGVNSDQEDGVSGAGEDEEQRGLVKRKMLGNVRFIGELYKLGMLHEAIIHQCIKELLEKRKRVVDMCENLECLCHLLTTVGKKLDTNKAKGWMDKYFQRIESLARMKELPARIRFMLLDLSELRLNKWVPRKSRANAGPKPIVRAPQHPFAPSSRGFAPNHPPHPMYGFHSGPSGSPHPTGLSHTPSVGGALKTPSPSENSTNPPGEKSELNSAERLRKLPSGRTGGNVSLRPSMPSRKFQQRKLVSEKSPSAAATIKDTAPQASSSKTSWSRDNSSDEEDASRKTAQIGMGPPPLVPPSGGGFMMGPPHPGLYRPPLQSMPMAPPHPMVPLGGPAPPPPGHVIPPTASSNRFPPGNYYRGMPPRPARPHFFVPQWAPPLMASPPPPHGIDTQSPSLRDRKEPPPVKHIVKLGKKSGPGSGGGKKAEQSMEESLIDPIIKQFLAFGDTETACASISSLSSELSPKRIVTLLMSRTLGNSEDDRTDISQLLAAMHKAETISSDALVESVKALLLSLGKYESTYPQCRNSVAGFLARAVAQDLISLKSLASVFEQGTYHPTVLVVLQALSNLIGQDVLLGRFLDGGISIASLLPPSERSHDVVTQLLESRNLGFLYPLKRIETELRAKLKQSDVTVVGVYKWLKNSIDPSLFRTSEFVMMLTKCILTHVTRHSQGTPTIDDITIEKNQMSNFKVLIQKFVLDDQSLQMAVLYATQVFCHDCEFPKGLMLRMFSYLYDMDVVEEEAFMKWKEDISQQFPGKGKALFQVNQWLVLLEEAEVESTDEDDD